MLYVYVCKRERKGGAERELEKTAEIRREKLNRKRRMKEKTKFGLHSNW